MLIAIEDLKLEKLIIIIPDKEKFRLEGNIEGCGMENIHSNF